MKRILIVDDDPEMRLILEHALKSAGYEVYSATDGQAGADVLRTTLVDLIITDIFMPNQEGLETITALHQSLPHVPIVAMSGGHPASRTMLIVAEQLGAARVIEKPFDTDTLLYAVEKAMGLEPHPT